MKRLCYVLAAVVLWPWISDARIKLVALPERARVVMALTHPDATLVEEERVVTLQKGVNRMDFSWRGVNIDPSTIQLQLLSHPDQIGFKSITTSYPPNENALVWEFASPQAFEERVRISYILSGFTREVVYKAIADPDEKAMVLRDYLRLRNNSGEDLAEAEINVGYGTGFKKSIAHEETLEMLSERVEGMPIKKTLSWDAAAQPWQPEYEKNTIGLPLYYVLKNDKASKLGAHTLLRGKARIFIKTKEVSGSGDEKAGDGVTFIGEDWATLTPVDREMRLFIGQSRDVKVTQRKVKSDRDNIRRNTGNVIVMWDLDEIYKVEVENFKKQAVNLTLVEHMPGYWKMVENSHSKEFKKKDAFTFEYNLELLPETTGTNKTVVTFNLNRLNVQDNDPVEFLTGTLLFEDRGLFPMKSILSCPRATLLAIVALLGVPVAQARINVTTLPGRDTVQLTVYNSADLTMVKETRTLVLRKGLNRLEFSWANTLIDPTSVEFRALTHADEVDVLDVSFPPRVTDTLEWRVHSEFAGEAQVEIRYFTSGISWAADYVAEAARNEKAMALSGWVRVNNNSGEDYENAQVRLVVGVVRLVEEIAKLANDEKLKRVPPATAVPVPMAAPVAARARRALDEALVEAENKPHEIVKEEMSEYFLYTVEGRDTIPNGWSKRMPSFKASDVPVSSYYKFEKERWGDAVLRHYRFTNSVPSRLGSEPLPDGAVKAFRLSSEDGLYQFVGATQVKYIPIKETVELELGNDPEVMIKPVLMDWQKVDIKFDEHGNVSGWTTKETWQFEVQNSKEIEVVLDIRRNFKGDWSLTTAAPHEKVDANKVKFILPLKPREKQTFSYELTTRNGVNVTR